MKNTDGGCFSAINSKANKIYSKGVLVLFCLIYCLVLFRRLGKNLSFNYNPAVQIILMACWAFLTAAVIFVFSKRPEKLIENRKRILIVFLILIFAIQFVVSLFNMNSPLYDHEKVFNGAVIYSRQGNSEDFQLYNNYLHHYTNNVGEFMLLQALFKIVRLFGVADYYFVSMVVGHILFTIMIAAAFYYTDQVFGSKTALVFLFITPCYIPVYFQSCVSYTDTYSVWAVPCILLFMHRALECADKKKSILYRVLAGVCLGLGMQIKATVAIIFIALFTESIFKGKFKKSLPKFLIAIIVFLGVNTAFHRWEYGTVMEESRADEAMPVTHFLMMGLQKDGSYSWIDEWEITCSVGGKANRIELNKQEIANRLKEMGFGGYLKLLYRKTCRTFGSGNRDMRYSYLYAEPSEPVNTVYKLVLENGPYYGIYNNFSNSFYLFMIVTGVAGAIVKLKEKKFNTTLAPYLGLVGFWLFMMLWESNHRQLINQWSLFFIVSAVGIVTITQKICDIFSHKKRILTCKKDTMQV